MNGLTVYQILDIVYYLLLSLILVPIGLAFAHWRKLNVVDKWLLVLLLLVLFFEGLAEILRWSRVRNHFLVHPYTFILFCLAYTFFQKSNCRKIQVFPFVVFFLLMSAEVILVGYNQLNSFTYSFVYLFLLIQGIISINRMFKENEFMDVQNNASFWYFIAFSFWGGISFIPALIKKYMIETSIPLYYFFDTLQILSYGVAFILFAIGFSKKST